MVGLAGDRAERRPPGGGGTERPTRACGTGWSALSEMAVCAEWSGPVVGFNRIKALTDPGLRARELREPKECRVLSTCPKGHLLG